MDELPLARTIVRVILFSVAIGAIYGLIIADGNLLGILRGSVTGLVISALLVPTEVVMGGMHSMMSCKRLPFLPYFVLRMTFTFVAIVLGLWAGVLAAAPFHNEAVRLNTITDFDYLFSVGVTFVITAALAINRLLGQNILFNFLTGRYYAPVLEERIFLFVDLVGSTSIAERIGPLAFHRLLNRFIIDITHPIARSGGEIYKYVGDEVIATWSEERGLEDARCVRACLEAAQRLHGLADDYERMFGVRPQFRAGMHCGVSVTGEMGSIRQEIAYLGDVVNTTARIQQSCREIGHNFLISQTLFDRLRLPQDVEAASVGKIELRGKKDNFELFAISLKTAPQPA